ncbi:MAG: GNAT family N-acetyltransferase, partial [Oceanospirillales bacterium]
MYQIRFSDSIDKIPASTWNELCNTDYPFIQHAFLKAMEDSGSVTAKTGWQPMHMTLVRQGETVGVMPLYIKNHSYGEYVFDWSWADAWTRQGLDYYPKLVTAIPYTPAQGPRMGTLLSEDEALGLFYTGILQLAEQIGASSWHGLFVNP